MATLLQHRSMAPDVLDVIVATLGNPLVGLVMRSRKSQIRPNKKRVRPNNI